VAVVDDVDDFEPAAFWGRLRRRKVWQWAVAYAAASFAVLQGLDIVAQQFDWPAAMRRLTTLALVLGFFVTLVLAWFHGERGVQRVTSKEILLLALLLAIGGSVLWRYAGVPWTSGAAAPTLPRHTAPAVATNPKSIAVMPFRDLSGGPDAGLIADGFSEEVINSLSRVPDLQVAARSSSFALRDASLSAIELGSRLRVAHVLEGSVRRAGSRLRITTQLIRSGDGINVWSQDYDRTSDDIIAIQEEVARSIAQALQTVTDPATLADMQRSGTRVVAAYDEYLKGLALRNQALESGNFDETDRALAAFDAAIALDPGFPEAHQQSVAIALTNSDPTSFKSRGATAAPLARNLEDLHQRLGRASREVRDRSQAHIYLAWRARIDLRLTESLEHVQRFLAIHPQDVEALNLAIDLSSILDHDGLLRTFSEQSFALSGSTVATNNGITGMMRSRDQARAVAMAREAIERFPGNADTAYQAQRVLLTAGRVREAAALVPVVLASDMLEDSKGVVLMRQACAERRRMDAEALYDQLVKSSPDALVRWHGLMLLGRDRDAAAQLEPYNRADTVYALSTMMVYPKFDARPFPALVAALESHGIAVRPPRPEPYNCPAATAAS
jgi:TolB-like protein